MKKPNHAFEHDWVSIYILFDTIFRLLFNNPTPRIPTTIPRVTMMIPVFLLPVIFYRYFLIGLLNFIFSAAKLSIYFEIKKDIVIF